MLIVKRTQCANTAIEEGCVYVYNSSTLTYIISVEAGSNFSSNRSEWTGDNARRLVWQAATPQQQLNIGSADEPFRFCADRHSARYAAGKTNSASHQKNKLRFEAVQLNSAVRTTVALLTCTQHHAGARSIYMM